MKKLLLVGFLLFFLGFEVYAQKASIGDSGLVFDMPNAAWYLADTQANEAMEVFFYKRKPITDSAGRQIIANISIISESNQGLDVVTYAAMKRAGMPFDVQEIVTAKDLGMDYQNGIIFKGSYEDQYGPHTLIVSFLSVDNTGLRVICDILTEQYDELEPEFLAMLKSISLK